MTWDNQKNYDQNNFFIVVHSSIECTYHLQKVYCVEYCKEFGSTTRDHSKNAIYNFFANFLKKINPCLTYTLEIGAEEREFSLVITLNHKHVK